MEGPVSKHFFPAVAVGTISLIRKMDIIEKLFRTFVSQGNLQIR